MGLLGLSLSPQLYNAVSDSAHNSEIVAIHKAPNYKHTCERLGVWGRIPIGRCRYKVLLFSGNNAVAYSCMHTIEQSGM